jgi:aminomethyltransferase
MGQIRIDGKDTAAALETVVPGDICSLQPWRQRYSVLTNQEGGIIDDQMITRMPDHFFLVVNAACKERDIIYLRNNLGPEYRLAALDQRGLLALQGPRAAAVLGRMRAEIAELPFLGAGEFELGGINCLIHRCGYTGEDGYEISMDAGRTEDIARTLLADTEVKPAGLGARDSLRLEAGLCLYGHDLDETTTPVEAGLNWVIAKKYSGASAVPARFPGAAKILEQLAHGPGRVRLGFKPDGRIPVREGATIVDGGGAKVGIITSGGYGQTVGGPLAMGYVATGASLADEYQVEIRKHMHKVFKVELPFVKHRYYRKTR